MLTIRDEIIQLLCFLARHNLQDKVLEKQEQKILARYYLTKEPIKIIAKDFKKHSNTIWAVKKKAEKKLKEFMHRYHNIDKILEQF